MNQEERQEIKSIISDTMIGIHTRTEAKYDIINLKLDGINDHLDNINGAYVSTVTESDVISVSSYLTAFIDDSNKWELDQFYLYDEVIGDAGMAKLYNGGAGI